MHVPFQVDGIWKILKPTLLHPISLNVDVETCKYAVGGEAQAVQDLA